MTIITVARSLNQCRRRWPGLAAQGGALGVLLMVLARLRVGLDPALAASVAFGSPPVLASSKGNAGAGQDILQACKLIENSHAP